MKDNLTHWLKLDPRKNILESLINNLDSQLMILGHQNKIVPYYDADFLFEESEMLLGIGLISFQIYINANLKDLKLSILRKKEYYQLFSKIDNYNSSGIELIISLANYAKHKEEDETLHTNTKNTLESFKLNTDLETEISDSPIFKGIELISPTGKLSEVFRYVINWRDSLWNSSYACLQ